MADASGRKAPWVVFIVLAMVAAVAVIGWFVFTAAPAPQPFDLDITPPASLPITPPSLPEPSPAPLPTPTPG